VLKNPYLILSYRINGKTNKIRCKCDRNQNTSPVEVFFHPELARVIFSLLSGPVFLAWIFHEFGRIPFNSLMKL